VTDVIRCVLCPASSTAASWTTRTLAEPVALRNSFDHNAAIVLPGAVNVCGACSVWLSDPDRDEQALPAHLLEPIDLLVRAATPHAITARQLRADLIGQVRHLAAALGDPQPLTEGVPQ
jgi:hypothetical protein